MITLSSLDDLKAAQKTIGQVKQNYPVLFEKLLHAVYLTRALQFKYQYMGNLLFDEVPLEPTPKFVQASILRLYKREIQVIKIDENIDVLHELFNEFKQTGYAKISLLIMGKSPEAVIGTLLI
ncbi:hypothetical protein [Heyndrickxia acidicola]|uniref:Uncharacterized protein n=1 Tax=Heyndrickxia acidicola TaxID=209389 RepID=A0ABU6MAP3_9BACI|nr:hypothetical protein [Heyndrickxia acidicola]MED1201519.1 hypothetical protein [Heyndrickxia acidicola]